jgi:glucokinase
MRRGLMLRGLMLRGLMLRGLMRRGNRMSLAIGVDVGGTKVAAGVVDAEGKVVEKVKRLTPAYSPPATEQVIVEVVTELLGRHEVVAVGIGAAGFVDETRSTVLFAPNLAWRDEPVKRQVESRLGTAVVVENDANAAAWAESRFGAARGQRDMVLIAVGTGIGAGVMLDGRLYRGRWGAAGEPGHYRVVPDGRLCGCGNRGCWEQYVSGNALVAEAREFARRSPGAAVRLLQLAGGSAEGIDGPAVTQATRSRCAASRSSATGSAPAWPTWPPSWTPAASSSAAACPRPVTSSSARPGPRSRAAWPAATTGP